MKKAKYAFSILLLQTVLLSSCKSSPEVAIENQYQNCVYQSLNDNGEAYKRFMRGFEKHLISLDILKDSKPSSYFTLYKSIANHGVYPEEYEYSYIDSLKSIERTKIIPWSKKCYKVVSSKSGFYNSTMGKINKLYKNDDKKETTTLQEIMKRNLTILEEKDFEFTFYKHRTLIYLQMSGHLRAIDESYLDKT